MFPVLALLSLAGVLAAGLALASARRSPACASRRTQSLLPLLHPSDAPLGSPPLDSPPPSPTGFGPLGSSSALSDDLRWRIVYKRLVFDMTFAEIADDLLVSESSACEIWRRFETPPHDISSHQGERLSPAIVPPELYPQLLDCLTQCNMEDSLSDVCSAFYNVTGIRMSIPTMCQTLKRMGMTRKRARYPSPPHQRVHLALSPHPLPSSLPAALPAGRGVRRAKGARLCDPHSQQLQPRAAHLDRRVGCGQAAAQQVPEREHSSVTNFQLSSRTPRFSNVGATAMRCAACGPTRAEASSRGASATRCWASSTSTWATWGT